jgi:hypothetical protein
MGIHVCVPKHGHSCVSKSRALIHVCQKAFVSAHSNLPQRAPALPQQFSRYSRRLESSCMEGHIRAKLPLSICACMQLCSYCSICACSSNHAPSALVTLTCLITHYTHATMAEKARSGDTGEWVMHGVHCIGHHGMKSCLQISCRRRLAF